MGQQFQQWRSAGGEKLWLSMLIEAMERVSRSDLRNLPCDRSVRAAVHAHLARPAAPCAPQGSRFDLLH